MSLLALETNIPQREQPPRSCRSKTTAETCDFAIGQHILENPVCKETIMATYFGKLYNAESFIESIMTNTGQLPTLLGKPFGALKGTTPPKTAPLRIPYAR